MKYQVFTKDGTIAAETHKIEYNDEWMGSSSVTASFKSPTPINFTIGDYIIYRGDKFRLANVPTVKKISSNGSVGDAFSYDNVKFVGYEDELTLCEMRDVVMAGDTTTQYTSMLDWNVYCYNVYEFCKRIKANLDRLYVGDEAWNVYLKEGDDFVLVSEEYSPDDSKVEGKKDVVVSISNQNVWEGLTHVKDDFGLNFIIRGKNIYVGTEGIIMPHRFAYGKGKGLYQIERITDDNQQVITRLRAYGSTKNMPLHFYNNANVRAYENYTIGGHTPDENNFDYSSFDTWVEKAGLKIGEARAEELWRSKPEIALYRYAVVITAVKKAAIRVIGNELPNVTLDVVGTTIESVPCLAENNELILLFKADQRNFAYNNIANEQNKIYFLSGINTYFWNKSKLEAEGDVDVPNNMSVNNLMLPGFGTKSLNSIITDIYADTEKYHFVYEKLRDLGYPTEVDLKNRFTFSTDPTDPRIDSSNAEFLGVREGSVIFDGSVDDYDEIYPSLQYASDNNLIVSADRIEDDGIFDDKREISNFHIVVNLDFNPADYVSYGSTSFTVHMQSGYCGGRDFNCVGVRKVKENQYRLTLQRAEDTTLQRYFPYSANGDAYQIKAGDKFVLVDLDMPREYIELTAINALLPSAIRYLQDNDYTASRYSIKIDSIQMQRWCDEQKANNERTIYEMIKAGDFISFVDDDIEIEADITIDKLTIKEGDNFLPIYEAVLSEDKTVGTITKIQNKLSSIAATISRSNNGNSDRFLSRKDDDIASGNISFKKGIDVQEDADVNGNVNVGGDVKSNGEVGSTAFGTGLLGSGWRIGRNGHAEMDSLALRKFLEVPELRYNRTTVLTGIQWHTIGAGLIESVMLDRSPVTGQLLNTGIIKLKLEDGEYGAIAVDDICMGIYHNESGDNEDFAYDGRDGNFKVVGFQTIYFKVDYICDKDGDRTKPDSRNQYFHYTLRPVSEMWTAQHHPQPSMSFASYANFTNKERQCSVYSTTEYSIMLVDMDDWTYDGNNISLIEGNLNGFTIPAEKLVDGVWVQYEQELQGYGLAFGNAYMWGNITQYNKNKSLSLQKLYYYGTNDTQAAVSMKWLDGIITLNDFSAYPISPTEDKNNVYQVVEYTYSDGNKDTSTPALYAMLGTKGYDGCVIRPRGEWDKDISYVNESNYAPVETDVRYIDVVQYKDGSTLKSYKRNTYVAGYHAGILPTDTMYWTPSNDFDFVATDVLMSNEAWIKNLTGKSIYVTDSNNNVVAGMQSTTDDENPQIFAGKSEAEANEANFRVYNNGHVVMNDVDINSEDESHNKIKLGNGGMQIIDENGNILTTISQFSPDSIDNGLSPSTQTLFQIPGNISDSHTNQSIEVESSSINLVSQSALIMYTLSSGVSADGGILNIPSMTFTVNRSLGVRSGVVMNAALNSRVYRYVNGNLDKSISLNVPLLADTTDVKSDSKKDLTISESHIAVEKNKKISILIRIENTLSLGIQYSQGEGKKTIKVPDYSASLSRNTSYAPTVSYDNFLNKILGNGFVFSKNSDKLFAYINNAADADEALRFVQGKFVYKVKNQMALMSRNSGTMMYNANPIVFSARFDIPDNVITGYSALYNPQGLSVIRTYSSPTSVPDGQFYYYSSGAGKYEFGHNFAQGTRDYIVQCIVNSTAGKYAVIHSLEARRFEVRTYSGSSLSAPVSLDITIIDCSDY